MKNGNTIFWIIGAVILVALILNSQVPKETGMIGLTPHYYKDGVEVIPEKGFLGFSIVTPPGGSYDQILFDISGTATGVPFSNIQIVDAYPLAFKNALPITFQSLNPGQTKKLWGEGDYVLMDTAQFEGQTIDFWIEVSAVNDYTGETVYADRAYSGGIIFEFEPYQETADSYSFSGNMYNQQNSIDGNWDTYSYLNDVGDGIVYIDYSKPVNALPSSKWKIKASANLDKALKCNWGFPFTGIGEFSFSNNIDCWNQEILQLRIRSMKAPAPTGKYGSGISFECYDGASWKNVNSGACIFSIGDVPVSSPGCEAIFEEAMVWGNSCDIIEFYCYNDDVYWYDGCGVRGNKKEECGSDEYVGDNYCSQGHVYRNWVNNGCSYASCYSYYPNSEKIEDCGTLGCTGGVCNIIELCPGGIDNGDGTCTISLQDENLGDAYADQGYPSKITGGEDLLGLHNYYDEDIYIKFDLSSIPEGTLNNMSLGLALISTQVWDGYTVLSTVYEVTSDFDESSLTWLNIPSINTNNFASSSPNLKSPDTGIFYYWGLNSEWTSNYFENKNILRLKVRDTGGLKHTGCGTFSCYQFASKEYSISSLRPKLVITYTPL